MSINPLTINYLTIIYSEPNESNIVSYDELYTLYHYINNDYKDFVYNESNLYKYYVIEVKSIQIMKKLDEYREKIDEYQKELFDNMVISYNIIYSGISNKLNYY